MRATATALLGALTLASTIANAQDARDLARCVDIDDAESRLECYDEAAGRDAMPALSPEPDEPAPLTQEVGQEQLDSRPASKPTIVAGRVTECRQESSGRWRFVFANGQVWRQRSEGRRKFRDCDFNVTITRDFFGYKMQIDGEKSWIRIGRIR